jgi:hypothetical protein
MKIRHRFQKDLLRDVAGRGSIATKEIESDGIDFVLMGLINDPKGVPVPLPAGFYDFSADLRFTQTHRHRRLDGIPFDNLPDC